MDSFIRFLKRFKKAKVLTEKVDYEDKYLGISNPNSLFLMLNIRYIKRCEEIVSNEKIKKLIFDCACKCDSHIGSTRLKLDIFSKLSENDYIVALGSDLDRIFHLELDIGTHHEEYQNQMKFYLERYDELKRHIEKIEENERRFWGNRKNYQKSNHYYYEKAKMDKLGETIDKLQDYMNLQGEEVVTLKSKYKKMGLDLDSVNEYAYKLANYYTLQDNVNCMKMAKEVDRRDNTLYTFDSFLWLAIERFVYNGLTAPEELKIYTNSHIDPFKMNGTNDKLKCSPVRIEASIALN